MDVPDKLVVQDASGQQTIELNGQAGDITAGGNGETGDLLLNDKNGKPRVRVGWITETGHSVPGQPGLPVIAEYWGLKVQNGAGTNVVQLIRRGATPRSRKRLEDPAPPRLRKTLDELAIHCHRERNHQGLANELIVRPHSQRPTGAVRRRQRMGGILNYDYRSAPLESPRCPVADPGAAQRSR